MNAEFIDKSNILSLLEGSKEDDLFPQLDFGIGQLNISIESKKDVLQLIEDDYGLEESQIELIKSTDSNQRFIKIEFGFGHAEIEFDWRNENELNEIYYATKCMRLLKIVDVFLAGTDNFKEVPDLGMCPGFSFQFFSILFEPPKVNEVIDELNVFLNHVRELENKFTLEDFKNTYLLRVDNLRYISTNTQTRYLPILGKILKEISYDLRPISIIKTNVLKWSYELYTNNDDYRIQSGILHKKDKNKGIIPTTAFEHYVTLLDSLGLIARINDFVRCTKNGIIYLQLLKNEEELKLNFECLTTTLFFQYWIFNCDADAIILLLQIISGEIVFNKITQQTPAEEHINTEIKLREHFTELFSIRIQDKVKYANSIARNTLQQKFMSITRQDLVNKQKGVKFFYSEKHSVPPRLSWMTNWGLLALDSQKRFVLTETGENFRNNIPLLPLSDNRDVIDKWLQNEFFKMLSNLNNFGVTEFESIEIKEQDIILSSLLENVFEWQNDGALRLSYYPTFLFICLKCITHYKVVINFSRLNEKLENFITKDKTYILHLTPSLNESYVSIILH